eukprot:TRINITY_DN38067_c0_g1_i1.p1 TRINITY_DN38067_c0_g1~~TRINITY_DN38067_c0_g1_i1.p1  ORF type:complete len:821 (-),score=108.15 TRINITY_DN38067_c0_g1_i1:53-2515(-)
MENSGSSLDSRLAECFRWVSEAEAAVVSARSCLVDVCPELALREPPPSPLKLSRASSKDSQSRRTSKPDPRRMNSFGNEILSPRTRRTLKQNHGLDSDETPIDDFWASRPPGTIVHDQILLDRVNRQKYLRSSSDSLDGPGKGVAQQDVVDWDSYEIIVWKSCCGQLRVPILNPESMYRMVWLVVGLCFHVYEAFMIPVYLSFAVEPEGVMWWFGTLVNVYFILDIPLTFFTGFNNYRDGLPDCDPIRIAVRYIRSWLLLDLLASVPWEWLALSDSDALAGSTKSARLFRIFRILRMLRLLRIMKVWKLLDALEHYFESHRMAVFLAGMARVLCIIILIVHWSACLWHIVGDNSDPDKNWILHKIGSDASADSRYVWSLYFALTTMSTVGYGDITPQNSSERQFTILYLIISALVFSTLLGVFTDLVSNLRKQVRERNEARMQLARYMKWRSLPRSVASRIRQYVLFHFDHELGFGKYEEEIKAQLPPVLRLELCSHVSGNILADAPFLSWMAGYGLCMKHLSGLVETKFFETGDWLFKLGEVNDKITVLMNGVVRISLNDTLHNDFAGGSHRNPHFIDRMSNLMASLKSPRLSHAKNVGRDEARRGRRRSAGGLLINGLPWMIAKAKLADIDNQRSEAAITLQRFFRRRKLQKLVGSAVDLAAKQSSSVADTLRNMSSSNIPAPAYFGESCLWTPLEKWNDLAYTSFYVYSARCLTRGQMMVVTRSSIHEVIDSFSPWLSERFEQFRRSVIESSADILAAPALSSTVESSPGEAAKKVKPPEMNSVMPEGPKDGASTLQQNWMTPVASQCEPPGFVKDV